MNYNGLPLKIALTTVLAAGLLFIIYPLPPLPDNRLQMRLVHPNNNEVGKALSTGEAPDGYELLYKYSNWMNRSINEKKAYLVEKKVLIDARFITDCFEKKDSTSNSYYLVIKLDGQGSHLLEKITKSNIDRQIAIILERKLLATLFISETLKNGSIKLHGIGPQKIIREIADLLRAKPNYPGYVLYP